MGESLVTQRSEDPKQHLRMSRGVIFESKHNENMTQISPL